MEPSSLRAALVVPFMLVLALTAAYALGFFSTHRAVRVEMLSPLVLDHSAGDQGSFWHGDWFRVIRGSSGVRVVKLRVELGNVEQLRSLYKYLDIALYAYAVKGYEPFGSPVLIDSGTTSETIVFMTSRDLINIIEEALKGYQGFYTPSELADDYVNELAKTCTLYVYNLTDPSHPIVNSSNCTSYMLDWLREGGDRRVLIWPYVFYPSVSNSSSNSTTSPAYVRIDEYNDGNPVRTVFSQLIGLGCNNNTYVCQELMNYTLRFVFKDGSGNELFEINITTRFKDNDLGNVNLIKTALVYVPVYSPKSILGLLSLDKPVTYITLGSESWGGLNGDSVLVGANVFYEGRGGVFFDKVPVQLKVTVTSVS